MGEKAWLMSRDLTLCGRKSIHIRDPRTANWAAASSGIELTANSIELCTTG
jgi:hypothetical protein